MSEDRNLMEKALKEILIPELRKRKFKGSFPHFRRIEDKYVDYLTIQFNSSGGSFIVEIASSGINGVENGFAKDFPISKLNVQYFGNRFRLGTNIEKGKSDHWFEYGNRSYDDIKKIKPYKQYQSIAMEIMPLLDSQAEIWWNKNKHENM